MAKFTKEEKNEIKNELRNFDFVSFHVGIRIIVITLIIVILCAFGGYKYQKWKVNKDREIFKQSVTYTESAASTLADYYEQYNNAESQSDKNAIKQYVIMRYPNLDEDDIDNLTLRQFYHSCLIN